MADDTKIAERIDFFENALATVSSNEQIEQVNYMIWGSVATISKAFDNIEVRAESSAMMIIVKIRLRWFAKKNWLLKGFMDWQREQWRKEAIEVCSEFIPNGYRLFLYYEKINGRFI